MIKVTIEIDEPVNHLTMVKRKLSQGAIDNLKSMLSAWASENNAEIAGIKIEGMEGQ